MADNTFSLYEIDGAIRDVIEQGISFDDETGEVHFTADDLEKLDKMRADKMDALACVIKSTEAEAAALKAEEKALADRRKRKEKKAESLRAYVLSSMIGAGEKKLETLHAAFSTRKSARCIIEDAEAVPADYKHEETAVKIDLNAIKKAIKGGQAVPGAYVAESVNLSLK